MHDEYLADRVTCQDEEDDEQVLQFLTITCTKCVSEDIGKSDFERAGFSDIDRFYSTVSKSTSFFYRANFVLSSDFVQLTEGNRLKVMGLLNKMIAGSARGILEAREALREYAPDSALDTWFIQEELYLKGVDGILQNLSSINNKVDDHERGEEMSYSVHTLLDEIRYRID